MFNISDQQRAVGVFGGDALWPSPINLSEERTSIVTANLEEPCQGPSCCVFAITPPPVNLGTKPAFVFPDPTTIVRASMPVFACNTQPDLATISYSQALYSPGSHPEEQEQALRVPQVDCHNKVSTSIYGTSILPSLTTFSVMDNLVDMRRKRKKRLCCGRWILSLVNKGRRLTDNEN